MTLYSIICFWFLSLLFLLLAFSLFFRFIPLIFAKNTASSLLASVTSCLQNLSMLGRLISTSASRILNELEFCSIGLFKTLMSLKFLN